jgi:Tol biopolymer transport system component/DNA-binding winged helix-turn-helix (wHTH) protein
MEPHVPQNPLRYREFTLGDRVIRPDLNRIEYGGESVQVEPRVMDVLVYLAEHAGRVVSRDELLDRIWGETVVVEHVLTRAISELRRILADDPENPRFIETIRKRGYRLVAPVVLPEGGASPGGVLPWLSEEPPAGIEPKPAEGASAPARPPSLWGQLVWPAVVILVAALVWNLWRDRTTTPRPVVLAAVPFTTFVGNERNAAFSPDGTRIAFTWDGPQRDNDDIYVKQGNTESPLRLTEDPGRDDHAAWSPDGSTITFVRWSGGTVTIRCVPAIGGVERTLYQATSWVQGLDWALDGRRIVFAERENADAPYRIRVLDYQTLQAHDLCTPPAQHNDTDPRVSPDGRTVAFVREDLAWQQQICTVPLDGGEEPRSVSRPLLILRGLTWRNNGREIIFTSAPAGPASLWSLSIATHAVTPLVVRDEWVGSPSCPRRGSGLVYETWRCQSNVWEVRIQADGSVVESPAPLIQSMRWDGHARISPDGEHIVFASARSGNAELWACRRDGTELVRLTDLGGQSIASPCWSPDSKSIAFSTSPEGYAAVHVMDAAGGPARRLSFDRCNEIPCGWTSEGPWIYFAADRGGSWQIWRMHPDGTGRMQITQAGALEGFLSADGRWIYYIKPEDRGVWRTAVAGGPEEFVCDELSRGNRTNWVVHGSCIYYFAHQEGGLRLVCHDVGRGEVRQLVPVRGFGGPGIEVSPDGAAVLYARTDDALMDLMLVEGFR